MATRMELTLQCPEHLLGAAGTILTYWKQWIGDQQDPLELCSFAHLLPCRFPLFQSIQRIAKCLANFPGRHLPLPDFIVGLPCMWWLQVVIPRLRSKTLAPRFEVRQGIEL